MGFLDDVLGKAKEAAGASGGEHSGLLHGVLDLLGGSEESGGLPGLVRSFREKGLDDIISSWVGTGQNLPISGDQIVNGLGPDAIGRLAAKAGIPPEIATSALTRILPGVIDKLTPQGKIPEPGLLQEGLKLLRGAPPSA